MGFWTYYKTKKRLEANVLLEAVLAIALLSALSVGVLGVIVDGQASTFVAEENQRALQLSAEGLEGARAIRNADFANLTAGTYGLSESGGSWQLQGSPTSEDGFIRTIDITSIDADTWRIDSTVQWASLRGVVRELSLTTQVTNWLRAIAGWNNPNIRSQVNISGSQDGTDIFLLGGYVYLLVSGGNPDFVVFDVSDTYNPVELGSINATGTPFDHYALGNYVYVTSDRNNAELLVVDVSNPNSPNEINSLNMSGNNDARAITGDGSDNLYIFRTLGSGNDFLSLDVSNPTNPTIIGGFNMTYSIVDMYYEASTSSVFAITDSVTNEIIEIDVSNPASPSITTNYDLTGLNSLVSLDYYDGTIYAGSSTGGIFVVDINTAPIWTVTGTYSYASAGITDIDYDEALNYLFVSTNGVNASLSILNLNLLPGISEEGALLIAPDSLPAIINDITNDVIYAASTSNTGELTIFAPT